MLFKTINYGRDALSHNSLIICNKWKTMGYYAMIDTGASFPVWLNSPEDLKVVFTNNIEMIKDCSFLIGGFGNGKNLTPAYKIQEFKISDGKSEITYKDLAIACIEKRSISSDMIISYPMISIMNTRIIRKEQRDNLTCFLKNPTFEISGYQKEYNTRIYTETFSMEDLRVLTGDKSISSDRTIITSVSFYNRKDLQP